MDHHEKRHLSQMSFFVVIVGENSADYPEFVRGARSDTDIEYRNVREQRSFVACDKSSDGQSARTPRSIRSARE